MAGIPAWHLFRLVMTPAEVENQKGFVGAYGILNTFLNQKYSRITNPPNLSSDMRFAYMADSVLVPISGMDIF